MTTITAAGAAPAAARQNGARRDAGKELDKQAFLQLLTTQLRYQNPMEPMDNREFLAQLAQFSGLEQLQSMGKTMEQVAAGQKPLEAVKATLERILAVQEQILARLPAAGGTA